jgi:hypothetical protein
MSRIAVVWPQPVRPEGSRNKYAKKLLNLKKLPVVLSLIISLLIAITGCRGLIISKKPLNGWQDDDTFIAVATGCPQEKLSKPEARKASAKHIAILNAQLMTLEAFKGKGEIDSVGLHSDGEIRTFRETHRKILNIIKKGVVIKEMYDETQNCEIIFKVSGKGLKNLVNSTGYWRYSGY